MSVIICTYNRADLLADSVRAALRQDFPPELCEIIVVDNHSRDDTRSVVEALAAAHPGRVKYVFEGRQGLSFARNTGISSAAGEVLVFTDDDIDAEVSWLRELVATFDDEGVACAGGPIRPVWPHAKPAWLTDHWLGYYSVSEFPRARELGAFAGPDYPWGANIAFRAEALRSAGMFPTHLGRIGQCLLSNEEINLCRALEARGSRIAFAPEAVIHHKIAPQRLRKTWLMHRVYWQGRSEAILDLSMGVNIHRRLESSLMTLLSIAADPSLSVFDRRCLERSVFGYLQQALETLQERGPTGSLGRLRVMKALANKVGRDLVRAREDLERLGLQVEQGAQSAVALQQAVRERDERLSQLTGSISWRMTKPLRWAYDRLKKPGSVA